MSAYMRRRFAWNDTTGRATCHDWAARNCVDPGHRWPPRGFTRC